MNEQELARATLARLRQAESETLDFDALTDEELDAVLDGSASPDVLAKIRRVSKKQVSFLLELSDEELDNIIAGKLPDPEPSQEISYHE